MKGISTLLASILLIAFTLAVAVIIGSWLTSISSQQSSNVGASANQTVTCSKGILTIVSIPSATQVIVQNAGQIDLSGNFTLSCGTSISYPSSNQNLPKGGMINLTGSGCQTSGNKIRVSSHVCPQVYAECTYGTNCP
jgi:FlaG/FlaF family flagellin (archaellin)